MVKIISIAFLSYTLFRLVFPSKKAIGPKFKEQSPEHQDVIDIDYEEMD